MTRGTAERVLVRYGSLTNPVNPLIMRSWTIGRYYRCTAIVYATWLSFQDLDSVSNFYVTPAARQSNQDSEDDQ